MVEVNAYGMEFARKNERTAFPMASKEYMKQYHANNREYLNLQRKARVRAVKYLTNVLYKEQFKAEVEERFADLHGKDRITAIRHLRAEYQQRYYIEYLILLDTEQKKLGVRPT